MNPSIIKDTEKPCLRLGSRYMDLLRSIARLSASNSEKAYKIEVPNTNFEMTTESENNGEEE